MNNQTNWVVIGHFGRPYGIKGFVTVHSCTEPRDNILSYTDWHVRVKNAWQPVKLLAVESHHKSIVALIDGYPERELAAQLTNAEIAVRAEQLATLKPGEFYWFQLIGMQVVNTEGIVFGKVTEMMATGSNDVMVVEGEKKFLIPYLPGKYITDINTSQQIITVDWDVDF